MSTVTNKSCTLIANSSQQARSAVTLRNSLAILLFVVSFHIPGPQPQKSSAPFPTVAETGLPNFHIVEPYFWRGGAPNVIGINELKQHGVKTIIDLRRSQHSMSWESAYAFTQGIKYVNVPMGDSIPSLRKQRQVLSIIDEAANDKANGPVFLHCSHGSDRTGFMVACWRVQHDHWSSAQAFAEMLAHGFFIHKWQPNRT